MAIANPFRRRTPNTRSYVFARSLLTSSMVPGDWTDFLWCRCWGYTFELTKDHLSLEELEPLKHSYDVLGDKCLDRLNAVSPPPQPWLLPRSSMQDSKAITQGALPLPERDLYLLLRDQHHEDPLLEKLWDELNVVPAWVDWAQIERGQDVFYRYGGAALTGLAYQSLLGGMGAARVVETLARTGGFSTKVARRRMFETTQHILQCTRSLDSIQPGGSGFASSIRVRFLHAAVRRRILKLAAERPEYYDVQELGIPINDLDSMATIATFSATLIWISLPRQGIFLRQQEIKDYLALWRYVAYLVGCPDELFANPDKAKALQETLLYHEIKPSETSKILANNIIKSLDGQPPGFASADMLTASARWLNGDELADQLGLARPSFYFTALMAGQCLFFMAFSYVYRSIPYLDRRKVRTLKRIFYAITVESKYGLAGKETLFDFKYVPEFSTMTEMDESKEDRPKMRGVEARNLKALLIGVGVLGSSVYVLARLGSGLLHLVWR